MLFVLQKTILREKENRRFSPRAVLPKARLEPEVWLQRYQPIFNLLSLPHRTIWRPCHKQGLQSVV